VRTQSETFGTNAATIQTRADFTTNLVNTLQTGSDNLVLADQNQESANLLTLQTRQQLSISALSISNQAQQAVLKLFP
jgi:flagellin